MNENKRKNEWHEIEGKLKRVNKKKENEWKS